MQYHFSAAWDGCFGYGKPNNLTVRPIACPLSIEQNSNLSIPKQKQRLKHYKLLLQVLFASQNREEIEIQLGLNLMIPVQ